VYPGFDDVYIPELPKSMKQYVKDGAGGVKTRELIRPKENTHTNETKEHLVSDQQLIAGQSPTGHRPDMLVDNGDDQVGNYDKDLIEGSDESNGDQEANQQKTYKSGIN